MAHPRSPAPEPMRPARDAESPPPPGASRPPGGGWRPGLPRQHFPWPAIALALTINLLWGGNVPAVKVGLIAVPPLWSAFWRFLLGAVCLWVWARAHGLSLRPARGEWGGLAWLGLLFTVQIALMNIGIRHTTGAMAAILIATNPLVAGLLSHLFVPGDRLTGARLAGLGVAFAGICAIFLRDPGAALGQATTLGNGICLASAVLLGSRLVFAARLLQRIETTRVMVWQMLFSLPAFAVGGWLTEQVRWEALGWYPLAGIAYQGIVVAAFNFMGLAWLLRHYSPSVVTGYNCLSPVFGVLLSIALLGETVSWPVLAGMVAVGAGLYLVTRHPRAA